MNEPQKLFPAFKVTYKVGFPKEPLLRPIHPKSHRDRLFVLEEDFPFTLDGQQLKLDKGMETDLASIPQLLEFDPDNDDPRILKPALVHDMLCVTKGHLGPFVFSSRESARILADAMHTCGASDDLRRFTYLLATAGRPKWNVQARDPVAMAAAGVFTVHRSWKWPILRRAHLRKQWWCCGCGAVNDLDVHHIKPVHLFPEEELNPDNLITLCQPNTGRIHCHFFYGHNNTSWRDWNPKVREQCCLDLR